MPSPPLADVSDRLARPKRPARKCLPDACHLAPPTSAVPRHDLSASTRLHDGGATPEDRAPRTARTRHHPSLGDSMTSDVSSSPVAVVTGGARGIGLAIGRWFLAHGQCVALLDIDANTLAQSVAALDDPGRLLALHCDVSDPRRVQSAVEAIEARFGRID